MADYIIMKAVEFDKLPAKFKKQHGNVQALVDAGYWLQAKYDGCMGIASIFPGQPDLCRMRSRTGEDYTASCGHILEALGNALANAPRCNTPAIIIGEVWQPIDEAAFPEVSGKFRRQKPSPELKFVINDFLPLGFNTVDSYRVRYARLNQFFGDDPDDIIRIACTVVPPQALTSDVTGYAIELQGRGGYDGAIVRNPDAGYTVGTVKNGEIIKVKPTLSLDLPVIRLECDRGEKTGRDVYSVCVRYRGVDSMVGSGMPHDRASCPENGQIVEIECLGITADGKLREPRFKGIRFDKLEPDN
jgi:ATP-dependent DNA ligase